MTASIGIITCRRPEGLRRLLDALGRQKVSSEVVLDILVVDNACDQKVRDMVADIGECHKFPLKYFEEPEPGIVAARNKCVAEFLKTDSEYLLFIDDDEWPDNDSWAQDMLDAQKRYSSDIITSHVVSVGGQGVPAWATKLMYGKNRLVEGREVGVFYTNNLLLTRRVLEVIAPAFDQRFAMTGASDYHFSLRCRKAGFRAYYTEAPVMEDLPASRAKISWFMRRGYRSGIGFTKSHLYEDALIKSVPYCLSLSALRFIRGLPLLLCGLVSFSKQRIAAGLFRLSSSAGTLAGLFGLKYREYKSLHDQSGKLSGKL